MPTNFTKVGNEVQVNLAPNDNNNQFDPDVTALTDGRFFVVFTDLDGNADIIGQFVNADGTLSGSNIDIETDAGDQHGTAAAARADGGAIVVWKDFTDSEEIEFATVSSTGVVSVELDVLTGSDKFYNPDVAVLADGRALVVAENYDGSDSNIAFNFITAAGDAVGTQDEFGDPAADQYDAAVAAFGNNALVVYSDESSGNPDIKARFYNGTSFGAEVVIDDSFSEGNEPAVAALADGRFIIVWEDYPSGNINARLVGADGTPLGSTFTIPDGGGYSWEAAVAALPDGGFVVTWTNDGALFPGEISSTDFGYSVLGQRFDATGAAAGDVFLVHAGDTEDQDESAVAANAAGQAFAVFEDSAVRPGDANPSGIRGQAFVTTTDPVTGSAGSDLIEASALSETINGLDGNDNIFALGGNDIVDGGAGKDMVSGGDGNDTISGGLGHDILLGDAGADNFLFNTAIKPKGSNVDTIADFSAADDTIQLDDAIFTKLKLGALKEKAFYEGDEAHDKNDRIVYDDKSGELIYDKNGDKKGGEVVFAHLDPKLDLSAADFLVV